MADLDRLLRPGISQAAADAARPPDFTTIRRRGRQRRRTHTLLAAVAAVAVLIAVAGGIRALGTWESAPPGPAEQPAPRSMPTGEAAIDPGTYLIPGSHGSTVDYTVTFPDGWRVKAGDAFSQHADEHDEFGFESFVVGTIYANACRGERGAETRVGAGAQGLVAALLEQRGPAKSGPVETALGGYPATRVDLRVPRRLQGRSCFFGPGTGVQIWRETPDNYLVLDAKGLLSVYILDVDGERVVFASQYRRGHTSRADRAELQQVLDSIEIQP